MQKRQLGGGSQTGESGAAAQRVNEAFARLEKGDVKYRFVIDMASLRD